MSSGDQPKEQTVTTKNDPPPGAKELTELALPFAKEFAAGGLPAAPRDAVVGFNPTQIAGQQAALTAAGTQDALARQAAGASDFFLSGAALDPSTNKYLKDTIDYATAPVFEGMERGLANTRGEANQVGQLGGSRQALAEAAAIRDAGRTAGGIGATIANDAYKSGLDNVTKVLGLAPSTVGIQTAGAGTTSAVGEAQQNLAQQQRSSQIAADQADAFAPLTMAQALFGTANSVPGGSVATTTPLPKVDPLSQALGIAAAGGGIATSLIPFL